VTVTGKVLCSGVAVLAAIVVGELEGVARQCRRRASAVLADWDALAAVVSQGPFDGTPDDDW
jgi:hypothetical protein